MESRAKILGHPIHQMLVVFPLGLLATSLVFDIVARITESAQFSIVAFWMITAGIISGLGAAVFGLIDYLAIPKGTRARRVGAMHGGGNVIVIGLFIASWLMRRGDPSAIELVPVLVSAAGAALSAVTGWLGGELVDRLSVGVDDGAHLDAPSSLSKRPASDKSTRAA